MATSGSTDFSVDRDSIITEALQLCGVVPEGGTPTANQLSDSARTLNMLVKNLQVKGFNLFTIRQGIIFPEKDKVKYKLGGAGADKACNASDFVKTTVKTAYTSGTNLDVTSTTGMTNSDVIGVVLDDGTLEWRTLTVVDGDSVTLSSGLSSAAAAGNLVYSYTSAIPRPLRILSAFSRDESNEIDIEITINSKQEYDNQSNKTSESTYVNQLYYDPQLDQGLVYVWPEPSDMTNLIYIQYTRPLDDFDSASNTPDFPQEWYLPLSLKLASLLAVKYGVPVSERNTIIQMAEMALNDTLLWDVEGNTSIFVGLSNEY